MKLVSTNEFKVLEDVVLTWLSKSESGKMFSDSKGIAKTAIMEFMLNKDNTTLFTHLSTHLSDEDQAQPNS